MGTQKIENPVKLTDEVNAKLETAASMDATWPECALFANISVRTLMYWLDSVEGLRDRLQELRENPMLKARTTILNSLDDPKNAQWYAERKNKKEFAQKVETEHSGEVKVNVIKYDDYSDTVQLLP